MKNLNTNQTRFTAVHSTFKDATGMRKGCFRTRHLIKVLDNGVLMQEFTRSEKSAWICITTKGDKYPTVECKKTESAIKNSLMWALRKDENRQSILIIVK